MKHKGKSKFAKMAKRYGKFNEKIKDSLDEMRAKVTLPMFSNGRGCKSKSYKATSENLFSSCKVIQPIVSFK